MPIRLLIAAIFIAVGLGTLTVNLLHDPTALVPHPPYGRWIFVRLLGFSSLAVLGMLLVFGVVDEGMGVEDIENSYDHATFWRVAGIAFLISALATATFIAASAFVDYLDRVTD